MSLTGKSPADTYKDITYVDNNNSGVDSTLRSVKTGEGSTSSISLSDRALNVVPSTNNTATLSVENVAGTKRLVVDTSNDTVLALGNHVNTQYHNFGLSGTSSSAATAGMHVLMQSGSGLLYDALELSTYNMGTGTDPATSLTVSTNAHLHLKFFWYIHDNISIDAVHSLEAADAATGDTTRFHLFEYDYTDGSSNVLTNGTLVAHSADQVNAGYEQMYYNTWTIDSANISSGKVILCTMEADTVNSDYLADVTVKYHLR